MTTNYIDQIANQILDVLGEVRLKEPEFHLYRLYAVLVLATGEQTTAEDVHDAWSAWCATVRPDHPSLKPFNELSRQTQELDRPYVEAIHAVARSLIRSES